MRPISIGNQSFEKLRSDDCFYIDKTSFIKEWWEGRDDITLITRPRRFGKTFNMSMMECFFSSRFTHCRPLFEGLDIWKEEEYRNLQGTYPVINMSFAEVKSDNFEDSVYTICEIITDVYSRYSYLLESDLLEDVDKRKFQEYYYKTERQSLRRSLNYLCSLLYKHYGKKPLIFLDEYDTPLQEAWLSGYWDEMVGLMRVLFNSTFKTNPYLGRAIITGITRVSRESLFSDMNNMAVHTVTSDRYSTCFGFTEQEVFAAMDELGLSGEIDSDSISENKYNNESAKDTESLEYSQTVAVDCVSDRDFISSEKQRVKQMYDGFTFGSTTEMYNPWSITNYFDKRKLGYYWKNTSTNALVGKLILNAGEEAISDLERLIKGQTITKAIDEQIVFNNIMGEPSATWSLLLATGYLTPTKPPTYPRYGEEDFLYTENSTRPVYELKPTNSECRAVFTDIIRNWFSGSGGSYNAFIKSLLRNDVESMEDYINSVAIKTFSYFDSSADKASGTEPEKFYHGFVLGLLVDLWKDFEVKSNRESGRGRYDVMIMPKNTRQHRSITNNDNPLSVYNKRDLGDTPHPAYIIEFKVHNPKKEKTLEDTADSALAQIEEKKYETELLARGIPGSSIHKYGFAFRGKEVLIKAEDSNFPKV